MSGLEILMETMVARIAALRQHPVYLLLSSLLLTSAVVVALLFFSEFGGAVTDVIYGDF